MCATFCGCFSWCFAEVTKPVQFTGSHFACDPNKLLNAELGTRAKKGLQFTHVEPWREERVPSLSAVGCQLSVQLLWTCSANGSCGLAERAKTTQFKAAGVPVITLSLFSVCAWETLSSRELWRLVSFPHFVSSAEPVCLKLSCRLDHNQATLKIWGVSKLCPYHSSTDSRPDAYTTTTRQTEITPNVFPNAMFFFLQGAYKCYSHLKGSCAVPWQTLKAVTLSVISLWWAQP